MKILVLNGPNINMLGIREKSIYGEKTYDDLCTLINNYAKENDIDVSIMQSNCEGKLVTYIQNAYFDKVDAIIINPAAYTHTSIAILDALKAVNIPTVEVHISKVSERESYRQISFIRDYVIKNIEGEGFDGYINAIKFLKDCINERNN